MTNLLALPRTLLKVNLILGQDVSIIITASFRCKVPRLRVALVLIGRRIACGGHFVAGR